MEILPGEAKATTITLHNSSSSSLDVEVSIIPDSLDNGNLTFELDKSTFTMPGGSYNDVILSVTASGSATPGTYTAELELRVEIIAPPLVTTKEATGISARRANLNGRLTSLGTASSVAVYFEWGLTTDYGSTTTSKPMTKPKTFRARITNLTPATTYHFRAVAVSEDGTSCGLDKRFTTRKSARGWWSRWLGWLFPWLEG